MFEFDSYSKRQHLQAPAVPRAAYDPVTAVTGASFSAWSEHCIECAIPACYTTCGLYAPRQDQRCRRFVFGIHKNRNFPSRRGYGAEVVFKKWGKLETIGNPRILPLWQLHLLEAGLALSAPVVTGLGNIAAFVSRDGRFREAAYRLKNRLLSVLRHRGGGRPDAFLAEIYNPGEAAVSARLVFAVDKGQLDENVSFDALPPPFTYRLLLAPGYNLDRIDRDELAQLLGSGLDFTISIVPEGDEGASLVFLQLDFVTLKDAAAGARTPAVGKAESKVKCLAFDLDHTLWDGVLAEGDSVALKPGALDLLKTLDRRGVLLSIASKNSEAVALQRLRDLGVADYFLYPKINWRPKSENLRELASDLNISVDSIALIDDSLFELEEVAQALPSVRVYAAADLERLAARPELAGSASAEAGQRRQFYREASQRATVQKSDFANDYIGFLRSCKLKLEVRPYREADRQRVGELVQRTNQLNFSGTKYAPADLAAVLSDREKEKVVVTCEDRYGSYGTVGFCIFSRRAEGLLIEDLMLSCRIQGKFVEQALFAQLTAAKRGEAPGVLSVNFRETEHNKPALQVLRQLGFEQGADSSYFRKIDETPIECDFFEFL